MNLADRRRADCVVVKFVIQLLWTLSELLHEDSGDLLLAAGRDSIEQREQRVAVLLGEQIDLEGHDLAHFEKRAADPFKSFAQQQMSLQRLLARAPQGHPE